MTRGAGAAATGAVVALTLVSARRRGTSFAGALRDAARVARAWVGVFF